MASASAAKGDRFEREVLDYLRGELGAHLTRPRCGAEDDRGDIAGIPAWTLEAKCYGDTLGAIRQGLRDLEVEQRNAGTPYGAVIVKRVGKSDPRRALFLMELENAVPVMRELWTP